MTTAVRRLRVTWHPALDHRIGPSTEEVVLEEGSEQGPGDERRLQKILHARHPQVAKFSNEFIIDTVTPLDLVPALVLLVGAPGSRKTTWAQARFYRRQIVSLDELRERLANDAADQSATPLASDIQKMWVAERLGRRLLTVVDGTNAEPVHRYPLIKAARSAQMPIIVVHFPATVQECMANMAGRDRQVEEADVRRIDEEIHAGFVNLVGTTDIFMTVDQDGNTTKVTGYWHGIEYFVQWREELEARAKGSAR